MTKEALDFFTYDSYPNFAYSLNQSVNANAAAAGRPVSYTHLDVYKRQAVDRAGLLADVTQLLSNMHIFIHSLNSRQERNSLNAFISATITINGLPQLQTIIERLSKIQGVLSIDRT